MTPCGRGAGGRSGGGALSDGAGAARCSAQPAAATANTPTKQRLRVTVEAIFTSVLLPRGSAWDKTCREDDVPEGSGPSMNPRSLAASRPLSTRLLSAAVPWLLAATACAPPAPAAPPPSNAPPHPTAESPPATPATSAPDAQPTSVVAPDEPPFRSSTPQLARFHAALNELARKKRTDHVRILWLGDSHGQADFWSGQVRKLLAERFGDGGPGFVHLGYKNYRHDGVKLDIRGKWRMRPKKPVDPKRQGDGIYGLGGLMMSGYDDLPRVELKLPGGVPGGAAKLDLCYRFVEPGDALAYATDGGHEVTLVEAPGQRGAVAHLELTASTKEPFVVRPIGRTDLCGVVIEADPAKHPGVVLDTLAINGARYGTALAWEEAAWTKEVARRRPDLVIFEYGTNEAGDANPAYGKVEKQVGELLARVRSVSPDVDCVVVSPTDRGDAEARVTTMRKGLMKAAKDHGCFWFDAWEILGGEGAFERLSLEPDGKVQPDQIHLTIKGYRELGAHLFEGLVAGYGPASHGGKSAQGR